MSGTVQTIFCADDVLAIGNQGPTGVKDNRPSTSSERSLHRAPPFTSDTRFKRDRGGATPSTLGRQFRVRPFPILAALPAAADQ